jgi:ferredoxin
MTALKQEHERTEMAVRKIVKIDEALCNGCGQCVPACAEGAIQVIDGKARLVSDKYCDGLGACLGDCPEGAITIEEREADGFDEKAVQEHLGATAPAMPGSASRPLHPSHPSTAADLPTPMTQNAPSSPHGFGFAGCPGSRVLQFDAPPGRQPLPATAADAPQPSALRQWPVQLHLVPPTAPYFRGADVLLAADCTAFAMGNFHARQLNGKALAVACPKLDQGQEIYRQKLQAMIDQAEINTLTVLVMEVPCCAGLLALAQDAVAQAGRKVPIKQVVVGLRGDIISEEWV